MNYLHSQDLSIFSVEGVEFVETDETPHKIHPINTLKSITESKINHVEDVEKIDLADYFSRLSTSLKNKSVEEVRPKITPMLMELELFSLTPQIPREINIDSTKFSFFDQTKLLLVMDWIQIVVDEGHIEPSQLFVGRIVGWPIRSFSIHSLYVDFIAWCLKKGITERNIPERSLYFALLNNVLVRTGDRYNFPVLSICRENFLSLQSTI